MFIAKWLKPVRDDMQAQTRAMKAFKTDKVYTKQWPVCMACFHSILKVFIRLIV